MSALPSVSLLSTPMTAFRPSRTDLWILFGGCLRTGKRWFAGAFALLGGARVARPSRPIQNHHKGSEANRSPRSEPDREGSEANPPTKPAARHQPTPPADRVSTTSRAAFVRPTRIQEEGPFARLWIGPKGTQP